MFTPNKYFKIFQFSILTGALLLLAGSLNAQTDSIPQAIADSALLLPGNNPAKLKADTLFFVKREHHSPKIATISSAIIPGLGQAYNRKYWKVPIVYGAGALGYYFFDRNYNQFKRLRVAYLEKQKVDNGKLEQITDPQLRSFSQHELFQYMQRYETNKNRFIMVLGGIYVANIVDAMVDAHMINFDISTDLSMKVAPTIIIPTNDALLAAGGVKVSFRF